MGVPKERHPWLLRARNIDLLSALFLLVGSVLSYVFIPQLVSDPLIGGGEAWTTLKPTAARLSQWALRNVPQAILSPGTGS